ncbi:MAG: UDP-2,3-diacylglucosamine diphosphatase LpxI [Candidatus Melainabacteria bacterium]|nr:UDP-2,3-diacylglucosamine diphosphatase LpxI [Candidatus Melainabacteria bacterium]
MLGKPYVSLDCSKLIEMEKSTNTLNPQITAHKIKQLGLIAGTGQLPAILAKSAKERGYRVVALALSEDAQARVSPHCDKVYVIAPGQLGRNLKLIRQEGLSEVVFIGKVPKLDLLRNILKLDWTAIKELSTLPNLNDDTIQFAVGGLIEAQGIKVLRQSDFLRHLFPDYGVLTKGQPSAGEYADVEFGFKVAKEIARLDIGQTVIVKDQMILAMEAIEGTDEAIRRAVRLAQAPVVVVKVSKPNQDQRFDIPTVGLNTLNAMLAPQSGGVLAVEAKETMLVEQDEMIKFAHQHNISIVSV